MAVKPDLTLKSIIKINTLSALFLDISHQEWCHMSKYLSFKVNYFILNFLAQKLYIHLLLIYNHFENQRDNRITKKHSVYKCRNIHYRGK